MSMFFHRTASGRAHTRATVALVQQTFAEGGDIDDVQRKLDIQNEAARKSFGAALSDAFASIQARMDAEHADFMVNLTRLPEDELRAAAANHGTYHQIAARREAAEAELQRRRS